MACHMLNLYQEVFVCVSVHFILLICFIEEWSPNEVEVYGQALIDTNKDFNLVAKKVGF
jgi:hypothetical protein